MAESIDAASMAVFDAVNTPGGCIGCSVWFRGRERQYLRFLVLYGDIYRFIHLQMVSIQCEPGS
jgi:hypothetical protein